MNNQKSACLGVGASLAALVACTGNSIPALAQSTTGPSAAEFTNKYGIAIVQNSTPMPAWPADTLTDGSGSGISLAAAVPDSARLRDIRQLARNSSSTWRKVYEIAPATADQPVTDLASATRMVDQTGDEAGITISGVPAAAAINSAAAADDGASVNLAAAIPAASQAVTFAGRSAAEAIADVAQQTHTHWTAVYVLAPIASDPPVERRLTQLDNSMLSQEQIEQTEFNNGPFLIHFASKPAPRTALPAATPAASQNRTAAQPSRMPLPPPPGNQQNTATPSAPPANASNASTNADTDSSQSLDDGSPDDASS